MKSIKCFNYKNTYEFEKFLNEYGYTIDDVKGFAVSDQEQYHSNILKTYNIHFNDVEYEYFKIVYFKSLNEYHQSRLGFNGNKLLDWYEDANVIKYKVKDIYSLHDKYVITVK